MKNLAWDDDSRTVEGIVFSVVEYRILSLLRSKRAVPYDELGQFIYAVPWSKRVRINIEKHIERMNWRLIGSGLHVYCVKSYGYMLWEEQSRSPSGIL